MQKFTDFTGLVVPLDRANVDTDQIIPKQYLKSIKRTGFGATLFDQWRYLDQGEPGQEHALRPLNKSFVLNQSRYQGASILLARENFGCGSSREHAPWALVEYGFRVIVAESFADIFYNNSFKNGLLLVTLNRTQLDQLFAEAAAEVGYQLQVSLVEQTITTSAGEIFQFKIDPFRKNCLLEGLDDIALTLQAASEIKAYEQRSKQKTPWLFQDLSEGY